MKPLPVVSGSLVGIAIVIGTISDDVGPRPPMFLGGYRVLAADFHVHGAIVGDGALAPWDIAREAQRQGLDAFALTSHNQVFTPRSEERRVGKECRL